MEGDKLNNENVRIHFNFKADGTYEQIMPAWEEKNYGKYTVSGDLITFELTSLDWLWDRNNGYDNVYDQYGCFWNPDRYDENRTRYPVLSLNSAKSGQIEHAPAPSSHSIKMAISCLKQYPESLFLAIVSYFTKTRGSSQ